MISYLYQSGELIVWSNGELHELKTRIRQLKTEERETVLQHQASAMGSQKWQVLDHFSDTLEKLRDISYSSAGFYEPAYKSFKPNYQKSSLRRRSIMDEVLRWENYFLENQLWFSKQRFRRTKTIVSQSKVAKEDSAYFI